MAYVLALITALSFLYSPRAEKANTILVTKPLVISQERNTPAYALFQQTQLIKKNPTAQAKIQTQNFATVDLTTDQVSQIQENTSQVSELKIEKAVLSQMTEKKLAQLIDQQNFSQSLTQVTTLNQFQAPANTAIIRGHFELKDGVGIVDHLIVLKRAFEGREIEAGQVDLKAGLYQIAVGAFEGEIFAEIKDRSGIVIGEDRQKISNLKRSGLYFEGPTLKLGRPSAFALNLKNADSRKISDQSLKGSFFSGNYALKKTDDIYPNVSRHSSTLAVIQDELKKTAPTLSVRHSRDSTETVLFSQSWVEGSVAYLSEKLQIQFIPETGVIIGRVLVDGRPVAGAQVVVHNQPGLEPYYLDQFLIPQTQQSTTSENGFFIIPGLNPGSYELTTSIGNRQLGTQQYLVETGFVSYQEIDSLTAPQTTLVRSFDAFTSEPLETDLIIPGLQDILNLESGTNTYKHFSATGLTEIVNRPFSREHMAYVYLHNAKRSYLHLPQIKESFLDYVTSQVQLNRIPETSIIIGFTANNNFDVHIADDSYNKNDLVFFDRYGRISQHQEKGGGFIFFNVSEGIQEIILQDKQTDRSFSTVFYSKPSYLFVSHFSE